MVQATVDPVRIPIINLSEQEIAEIEELIAGGQLPKDFLDRHYDAVDANVFGADAPKDRQGQRIEQGLGSPRNQTANSIAAYRKYCKGEDGFDETVKRMKAELDACNAERQASAPKRKYTRKSA